MKKFYVNGFLFNNSGESVALIRKVHFPPNVDWSKNPWNGIGGKIEQNETAIEAMVREFREETGVQTTLDDWKHFAEVDSPDWTVFYFRAFNTDYLDQVTTMTDEEVDVWLARNLDNIPMVPHLSFLLPYAQYTFSAAPAKFQEIADKRS